MSPGKNPSTRISKLKTRISSIQDFRVDEGVLQRSQRGEYLL
jgi:hypothetical protein